MYHLQAGICHTDSSSWKATSKQTIPKRTSNVKSVKSANVSSPAKLGKIITAPNHPAARLAKKPERTFSFAGVNRFTEANLSQKEGVVAMCAATRGAFGCFLSFPNLDPIT